MSKVSRVNTGEATVEKGFNLKKVGALLLSAMIIAAGIYAFGFTTKGRTIVRVMIDPTPAVQVYAAQDAAVDAAKQEFRLQVANPKAE